MTRHPLSGGGAACDACGMATVSDLVTPDVVDELATPSNLRLGREILDGDEIEVADDDPAHLVFRVGGTKTGRRRVELRSSAGGLRWSCTCTSDPDLFCKHLVAAALSLTPRTA